MVNGFWSIARLVYQLCVSFAWLYRWVAWNTICALIVDSWYTRFFPFIGDNWDTLFCCKMQIMFQYYTCISHNLWRAFAVFWVIYLCRLKCVPFRIRTTFPKQRSISYACYELNWTFVTTYLFIKYIYRYLCLWQHSKIRSSQSINKSVFVQNHDVFFVVFFNLNRLLHLNAYL